MALLKDGAVRDNILHAVADIPAYAYIAYINLTQVYLPDDYPAWEQFFLKHGWLILLGARMLVAIYDIYIRLVNGEEYIDGNGKIRRKSLWDILKDFFKSLLK